MSQIVAEYRVRCRSNEASALARSIAYEQTVELPPRLVTDPGVVERVVGDVLAVDPEPDAPDHHRVRVAYSTDLACGQLPQLLNLVYGNVSIFPGIRLISIELPPELLDCFAGPRFGIEGIRRITGVVGRPLLATAIKPRGIPLSRMARLAGDFAAGGGDLVKDDQNLNDRGFDDFRERVVRCAEAVAEANERGGHCLYFPHVAGDAEEMNRRLEFIAGLGLRGVLAAPFLLGPATIGGLARRHGLALMAHPALTGSTTNGVDTGIAHGVLLGTVFRLAGADVSIFPNFDGRFSLTREECLSIASALREPLGRLRPAWPSPAGGMDYDRLRPMVADYGNDSMFLIGGALLGHGSDLAASTRRFVEAIASASAG